MGDEERKAYLLCIQNEKEARKGFFLFCTTICCTLIISLSILVGIILVNWIMTPGDYEELTTIENISHSIQETKTTDGGK